MLTSDHRKVQLFLITVFLICSLVAPQCNEPKCKMDRAFGYKSSDCYNKNFRSIPKCVPSNVEALDLGCNRIRKINRGEIGRYSSLVFLYLQDNLLTDFADDTFVDLTSLKVLDLSLNAIIKLPPHIFRLPSLERLFFRQSPDLNLDSSLDKVRPIQSPLLVLDISYSFEEGNMRPFPNLGVMPFLVTLNITGNHFSMIKASHIASLCNLELLISSNVTSLFNNACECWRINDWLEEKKVLFTPLACPEVTRKCRDFDIGDEVFKAHRQCKQHHDEVLKKITMNKIYLAIGGTIVAILVLIAGYIVICKRHILCKKSDKKRFKHLNVRLSDISRQRRRTENVYAPQTQRLNA